MEARERFPSAAAPLEIELSWWTPEREPVAAFFVAEGVLAEDLLSVVATYVVTPAEKFSLVQRFPSLGNALFWAKLAAARVVKTVSAPEMTEATM